MFVIKYRKIFFTITILLVLFSFFAIFYFGLNFGIDFKGGSILEVSYPTAIGETDAITALAARPSIESVKAKLDTLDLGDYSIRPSGDSNFILRTKEITSEKKDDVLDALTSGSSSPKEERFNTIGPVIGKELRNKAFVALLVAVLGIVLFVTFAFRKVSEPV